MPPNNKLESTRESILLVSVRLFAEQGFDGVAMRQIATEANITLSTIYHHFRNKKDLFRAVETEIYGSRTEGLIQELRKDASAVKRLRGFMAELMDVLEGDPTYFKLVQRNLIDARQENHEFLVNISLQEVFDELKNLLNEYKRGSGVTVAPVMIFSTILGFETLRPSTRLLQGYRYTESQRTAERKALIDALIRSI